MSVHECPTCECDEDEPISAEDREMLRARSEAMLAARMTPARDPAEQMRRDLEDTVASAMDSVVRAFYAPGPSREGAQFTGLSAWLTTTPT